MQVIDSIRQILNGKGQQVWTISPEATVFEAIEKMAEKNIGALVVLDATKVLGIVSERDYTRKVILKGKSSKETQVREIMTNPVLTAGPDETVDACLRMMTQNRIRHLPILENDQLTGIISIGDLVNWIISAQRVAINQLQDYISGRYPG